MSTEIKVPALGESVSQATVARWLKKEGEAVSADEPLVELETDKVTLEVNAPVAGILSTINVAVGKDVAVGAVLGKIEKGTAAASQKEDSKKSEEAATAQPYADPITQKEPEEKSESAKPVKDAPPLSPAVRKIVEDNNLDPSVIPASGRDGRLTKGDVLDYMENQSSEPEPKPEETSSQAMPQSVPDNKEREQRVPMTRLRQKIAERLKSAQDTAAMLTTFNEVDMSALVSIRKAYKDKFEHRHDVRLGFMSFFVKATVIALQEFPAVNAEINGTDVIYKNHYDLAVAVSSPQGLVVPVLRDADKKSFAQIEAEITDMGKRAANGQLRMDEMAGGTFTITNGGVFGSMLSTPILNPPQSAILGMHAIKERPVVVDGEIKIRPIMYVALTYDHRLIDGREAVSFLYRIKEIIEDPQRMLIEV